MVAFQFFLIMVALASRVFSYTTLQRDDSTSGNFSSSNFTDNYASEGTSTSRDGGPSTDAYYSSEGSYQSSTDDYYSSEGSYQSSTDDYYSSEGSYQSSTDDYYSSEGSYQSTTEDNYASTDFFESTEGSGGEYSSAPPEVSSERAENDLGTKSLHARISTLENKIQMLNERVDSNGGVQSTPETCSNEGGNCTTSNVQGLHFSESIDQRKCGGFIELFNEVHLIHKLPDTFPVGYEEGCVWVVWTNKKGKTHIESVVDNDVEFDNNFILRIHSLKNREGGYEVNSLNSKGFNTSIHTLGNNPYFVIHFYGRKTKPGQGFHLKFMPDHMHMENSDDLDPKLFQLSETDEDRLFKYPVQPATMYGNHERVFVLGNSMNGKGLNISITDIDTEPRSDWLEIFWLDPKHLTKKLRSERRTGRGVEDLTVDFGKAVPFVLVFYSDESSNGAGFTMNYNYHDA